MNLKLVHSNDSIERSEVRIDTHGRYYIRRFYSDELNRYVVHLMYISPIKEVKNV